MSPVLVALLTDQYPSTVEEQSVHLQIDYPDVERDLNRWLPLVKLLLAIPRFLVLFVLYVAAFFSVVIAWFAILFTGQYPRAGHTTGGDSGRALGGPGRVFDDETATSR